LSIKINLSPYIKKMFDQQDYASYSFRFGLCSPIKDKETTLLTSFYGCRDAFLSTLTGHFKEIGKIPGFNMPMIKTSIAVKNCIGIRQEGVVPAWFKSKGTQEEWFYRALAAGVKIANQFEREAKWARRSKLYETEPINDKTLLCVIEGPKWWFLSTYTMSLYILLLRGAFIHEPIFNMAEKNITVQKIINALKKVGAYYYTNMWMWPILLNHRKELFGNQPIATAYINAYGTDGIKKLTSGGIYDKVFYNKFITLCNESKMPAKKRR
jgi:hypothetical protein